MSVSVVNRKKAATRSSDCQLTGFVLSDGSYVDAEFLLLEPFADSRHVVLVQEGKSV